MQFYTVPVASGQKKPLSIRDEDGKSSWKPLMAKKSLDEWRLEYDGCNIAVITGSMSGVFVIDIDRRELLEELNLPETMTVITRRGYHLYYKYPDFHIGNSVWKDGGIDVRGENGVAVYIGSVVDGWNYSFVNNAPIIEPTKEVFELIERVKTKGGKKPKRQSLPKTQVKEVEVVESGEMTTLGSKILSEVVKDIRKAVEGERNEALNLAAFRMGQVIAGGHADDKEVRATLYNAYARIDDEATPRQINATMASGIEAGKKDPYVPLTPLQVANALYECSLTRTGTTGTSDRLVLQAICYHVLVNDISTPIVSIRNIMDITGKGDRTVKDAIKRLVGDNVLARKNNRRKRSHAQAYQLGEQFYSSLPHNANHLSGRDIEVLMNKLPFGNELTDVQDAWAHREFGDYGRIIFQIMTSNPTYGWTQKELLQQEEVSCSQSTISNNLKKLVAADIVSKEGRKYYLTGVKPEAQVYRGRLETIRIRNQEQREQFNSFNKKNELDTKGNSK